MMLKILLPVFLLSLSSVTYATNQALPVYSQSFLFTSETPGSVSSIFRARMECSSCKRPNYDSMTHFSQEFVAPSKIENAKFKLNFAIANPKNYDQYCEFAQDVPIEITANGIVMINQGPYKPGLIESHHWDACSLFTPSVIASQDAENIVFNVHS